MLADAGDILVTLSAYYMAFMMRTGLELEGRDDCILFYFGEQPVYS